jgi:hypothetical protein
MEESHLLKNGEKSRGQKQFGSRKRRVIDGDRGGGCVDANPGKRELYLNPNPWRVLMQGKIEWMDERGVHEVGVVGCSLQGTHYMSGEVTTQRGSE